MTSIVMTIPPGLAEDFDRRVPGVTRTAATFGDLFASAKKSLQVMVPYVDPTFTALVTATPAPVEIVTTPAPGRPPRPNPVLERCASMRAMDVRYLNERRDRSLIFQAHAKLLIVDGERAYLGSANLTDTSVHYSLELGLLIEDRPVVSELQRIFDHLFLKVAVRGEAL